MPYVLLISVIIGVTNIIPFFGPFIGGIPAAIIILFVSPIQALWFIVIIIVIVIIIIILLFYSLIELRICL